MIYDAALSLRGWGPDSFAKATPDFLAAARWAVFTEAIAPMWRTAHEAQAQPMPDDPMQKIEAAKQKMAAEKFIAQWRPILFPEDDDVE